MLGIEEIFRRGIAAHQAGRLDDAATAYRAVVMAQPQHFDALNFLAAIEAQRGAYAEADRLLDLALAANPKAAPVYLNRGNVLQKLQRLDEALGCYDKALALMPNFPEALSNRGVVLKKLGRLDEALACYDKALVLRPDYAEALSNRGVALKELLRFDEALASYDRALAMAPGDAEVLNNRGVLLREMMRFDEALASYDMALARRPRYAEAWNNRGNVLLELKRKSEALESYERALTVKPEYAEAWNHRGVVLAASKRFDDALTCYSRALSIDPGYVVALVNRGDALVDLRRFDDALASYDKALSLDPDHTAALNGRGHVLLALQRFVPALACFDRVLISHPDDTVALVDRGNALVELERPDEARTCFDRALRTNPNSAPAASNRFKLLQSELKDHGAAVRAGLESARCRVHEKYLAGPEDRPPAIALFRLEHDIEQCAYLLAHGKDFEGLRQAYETMRLIHAAREARENAAGMISVSAEEMEQLALYDKALLIREPPALTQYLHPDTDWGAIETTYFGKQPEIVYFDNLLSPQALAALRAFCLESTVWKTDYANQYLGAFSNDGFISLLHLKIATELQEKMPRIFGGLGLEGFWAFKYAAHMNRGIGIHADFAKVNLNFWITPDEAVLDPTSGGLKVYDVPSPRDWPFHKYNSDKEAPAIYRFLKENGANCVTIPYRCNRAVLFNSALFHETDEIHFKDGYENRRINMTYLFGRGLPT